MKKPLSLFLALSLCLVLAACTVSTSKVVRTGYVSNQTSGSWSGRFKSYDGFEAKQISIPKGAETLRVKFSLAAEEGTLRFTAQKDGREYFDPDDVLEGTWEEALTPGARYALRIAGGQAKNGSFSLEWEFE